MKNNNFLFIIPASNIRLKFYILTLSGLLCWAAVFSQIRFGPKAGVNITKIDGKSFLDEFRYGYHLGGFAEIRAGEKFIIQPEVLWNQYATKVDSNYHNVYQDIFNRRRHIKLDYLSIPLLLNYKLLGKFLMLQAGPQFGILIDPDKNFFQNGIQAFKRGDFSLLGGAQVSILSLRVNARYFIGLNNINDILNDDKWRNQGFQVSVGWAF
ncbi:MAG: PorT family protein [Chitinophagaceae bacterium]|nr:PorT family protein [Chitinophagaceae bacterium]